MAKPSPQKDLLTYQKNGPDLAQACARLAVHKIDEEQFAESLVFAKRAKDLGVETPENNLAIATALLIMGKAKEAEGLCRNALEKAPDNRRGLILLGQALMALEKFKEAGAAFSSALALDEGNGEVLVDLGLALEAERDESGAQDYFDRAKNDHPGLFEELMDRADRLYLRYLTDFTRSTLVKAEKVAMKDAGAYYEMGLANVIMGFAAEAEKYFKTSIRLRPTLEAYRDLAALYERTNDLARAETFARANLQNAPDEPSLNLIMANCDNRRGDIDKAHTRYIKILELAEQNPIKVEAKNQIGRILDKQGNIEGAYENFVAAKELLKKDENIGIIDIKTQHQNLRTMTAMNWRQKTPAPPPPPAGFAPGQLVFFIGFPRSGTTLLQEVLDRHDQIVVTAEEPTLRKVIDMMEAFKGGYPASLQTLTPELIKDLRALYFYQANNFAKFDETTTLVDKMPMNLMQVPLILTIFPEAKIIFALRHPKAAIMSCLMQNFRLNNAMVNMTGLNEITTFYALVMGMWKKIASEREIPVHYIKYENLVADMEAETKKLTKFLGLPWTAEMMDYAKGARTKGLIKTPSYHQVVQPVYTTSLEKWRLYNKYFEPFEDRLKPFYELFGYSG
ncbi:MAG: tetratricopeptide repeat-containing sulfotransferase family protein [Alphaproteobacteria bacterium]